MHIFKIATASLILLFGICASSSITQAACQCGCGVPGCNCGETGQCALPTAVAEPSVSGTNYNGWQNKNPNGVEVTFSSSNGPGWASSSNPSGEPITFSSPGVPGQTSQTPIVVAQWLPQEVYGITNSLQNDLYILQQMDRNINTMMQTEQQQNNVDKWKKLHEIQTEIFDLKKDLKKNVDKLKGKSNSFNIPEIIQGSIAPSGDGNKGFMA